MVGRFAAIVGPLLWTLVVDVVRLGRLAVLSLLAMMVVSSPILHGVGDARSTWGRGNWCPSSRQPPALGRRLSALSARGKLAWGSRMTYSAPDDGRPNLVTFGPAALSVADG